MSQRDSGLRIPVANAGRGLGRMLAVGFVVLVVAGLLLSTFKYAQIDEGERGIIITQGAVEGVQEPGIFFRVFAPFTRVETVNIKRQTRQVTQKPPVFICRQRSSTTGTKC